MPTPTALHTPRVPCKACAGTGWRHRAAPTDLDAAEYHHRRAELEVEVRDANAHIGEGRAGMEHALDVGGALRLLDARWQDRTAHCHECKGAGGWQDRKLDWEPIEGHCAVDPSGVAQSHGENVTERLAVPGGWLVRTVKHWSAEAGGAVALAFVPDPEGAWQPVSTDPR